MRTPPAVRGLHRLLLGMVALSLFAVGCSPTRGLRRVPPDGALPVASRFGQLTAERQGMVDANCLGGMPIDTIETPGSTELVVRRGYVLEHSSLDKIPLWVCESVGTAQLAGHEKRSNRFAADPDLVGAKATPGDYRASGYDRGHQAPAGNQTVDPVLKDQTFYMSNMAPQRPTLNEGIWKQLEDKTRGWVARYGHAYEWTGPIRCVPLQPVVTEPCTRRTIGPNAVAVPLFFYKIIVVQDRAAWKGIAFVLPNTDFTRPYRLDAYLTSIEAIEQQTGVQFMPGLDARDRAALVSAISAMWP